MIVVNEKRISSNIGFDLHTEIFPSPVFGILSAYPFGIRRFLRCKIWQ